MLQNIRIVGDDLDNRSDIGGLINCAAIAGVDCYYQAKHIDCNVFDSRDVIVGSSGGIFAIPVRQNATWAKMPNFDLDKIKSRDRNRNPATFIIDDANDKKSQNQKYPARIYLLEGFTEHFYPEKRIILTGSTQDNPPSISLFDIDVAGLTALPTNKRVWPGHRCLSVIPRLPWVYRILQPRRV